jgi:hypothetical protein
MEKSHFFGIKLGSIEYISYICSVLGECWAHNRLLNSLPNTTSKLTEQQHFNNYWESARIGRRLSHALLMVVVTRKAYGESSALFFFIKRCYRYTGLKVFINRE